MSLLGFELTTLSFYPIHSKSSIFNCSSIWRYSLGWSYLKIPLEIILPLYCDADGRKSIIIKAILKWTVKIITAIQINFLTIIYTNDNTLNYFALFLSCLSSSFPSWLTFFAIFDLYNEIKENGLHQCVIQYSTSFWISKYSI